MSDIKSAMSDARRIANKKYNKKHYRQPPVSIEIELLAVFKNACTMLKVSQASVIKKVMIDKIEEAVGSREYMNFAKLSSDELEELVRIMKTSTDENKK